MHKQIASLIIILILSTKFIIAGNATPFQAKVGEKLPAISIDLVKSSEGKYSENVPFATFDDKVIILEFWATWCGACVKMIPHLNQLADSLQNQPVMFISITTEDTATVAKFLRSKSISIKGLTAFDLRKHLWTDFYIPGTPQTIIVNRKGAIISRTHPSLLSYSVILDAIKGKAISLSNVVDSLLASIPPDPLSTSHDTIHVPNVKSKKPAVISLRQFEDYDSAQYPNDSMAFYVSHDADSLYISAHGFDMFPEKRSTRPLSAMVLDNPPPGDDRIRFLFSWNISSDTALSYSHYFNNFGTVSTTSNGQFISGSRKYSDAPFKFTVNNHFWDYRSSFPLKRKTVLGFSISRKYYGRQDLGMKSSPNALSCLIIDQ
jgi:thiol-disulfide isomerase/thioredoxin